MTIALGLKTVLDSISDLAIDGVTVLDIDQIPEQGSYRESLLFPDPYGFITGLNIKRDSTGGGGTALMTMTYTLNYLFIYAPVGSGRGLADIYSNLTQRLIDIIEGMLENDDISGAVDMEVQEIPSIGIIQDPAGATWHGCTLSLRITEFLN